MSKTRPEPRILNRVTQTINPDDLGAVDPGVPLDPVGRAEGERDEDGHDDERPDGQLAGQRALAVNVRVGQDVVELVVVFGLEGGGFIGRVCWIVFEAVEKAAKV